MKKIIIFFCVVSCNAGAQSEKELFHVKYSVAPVDSGGNKYFIHSIDANLKFPLWVSKNYQLIGGGGYETLWTKEYPLFGNESIHGLSTQLIFNKNMKKGHSLLIFVSGGLFSDLKDITSEDFRFSTGIRVKTKLNDNFSFSYGLAYSHQFFGHLILPFVDFDLKISERLGLSGPVPVNTKLLYTLNDRAKLSIFIRPENATYRLSSEEHKSRYFQKKQWNTGFGFDYRVTNHWVATIRTGYSLRRKFELYESSQEGAINIFTFEVSGEKRMPIYSSRSSAAFAEIIISWIF